MYDIYRCLNILNFQNGCHYHLNKKIKISYISMFNAEKLHIKRTLVQILMKKGPTDVQMTFWGSRSLDKFITVPCYRSSILVLSTNINTTNFKYFKCLLFPNLFSFVPVYFYFSHYQRIMNAEYMHPL